MVKNNLFTLNFETVKRFSSQFNFGLVDSYEILQVLRIYIFKSGNEGTEIKYNRQHITVDTFKYFQISTKKKINRVNNALKWEL